MIAWVRTWWSKRREVRIENAHRLAEERRAGRNAGYDESVGADNAHVPDAPHHARDYDRDGTSTRLPLT